VAVKLNPKRAELISRLNLPHLQLFKMRQIDDQLYGTSIMNALGFSMEELRSLIKLYFSLSILSGTKRDTGKACFRAKLPKNIPQGLRLVDFTELTARLKSCPFKTSSIPAACLTRTLQGFDFFRDFLKHF
jgi:hypothetical protein